MHDNQFIREYIREGKFCVEIKDLSFLSEREGYSWWTRHRNHRICKKACLRADLILVHSDEIASAVIRYYYIDKSKIVVC